MSVNSASSPQSNYYRKRAFAAFQEGYFERVKTKRHYSTRYDCYHYWLPARLSPVLRFLRTYFRVLDTACNTPPEHRYRQTEFEYIETAILSMHHIRNRIAVANPILAGSPSLCPCPWALFGPPIGIHSRLYRHHFPTPQDIFRHYDQAVWGKGYNVVRVERPLDMKEEEDRLDILSNFYDKSANYILSVLVLLLADLIRNCGPDCGEFRNLFTNDKRIHNDDFSAWQFARNTIIEPHKTDFGEAWVKAGYRHSYMSPRGSVIISQQRNVTTNTKGAYWEVDVHDAFTLLNDLAYGESVEYHGEEETKPILYLPAPSDHKFVGAAHAASDYDDDDDEIALLEREFGCKLRQTSPENVADNWREMVLGWSGLD